MDQAAKARLTMNRNGSLWPKIIAFDNLLLAARKAQKAKRFRENVLIFNDNLEAELFELKAQLKS